MSTNLHWGILATGRIAKAFAGDLEKTDRGTFAAVASRSLEKAKAFAEPFSGVKALGSYEELVAADDIDAVYIATPHPQHAQWAIKLLRAGKHVLCEKPICVNAADAEAVVEAARVSGKVLMEAYMYRCHPVMSKLVELIKDGAIGDVQHIDSAFSFRAGDDPDGRLMNADLAGGGILDVGGYAVSLARLVAGAANGQPLAEPTAFKAVGHIGKTGIDEWTSAVCTFAGGIVASLRTGVRLNADNGLRVFGTEGNLRIDQPFIPARDGGTVDIVITKGGNTESIAVETTTPLYALEAETFAKAVETGTTPYPAMSMDDTLANMKVLDTWRNEIKLLYPFETEAGYRTTTVAEEPLARKPDATMPTATIDGIGFEVSKFFMGCDNQALLRDAAPLYDAFFEAGGNGFDTASVYGRSRSVVLGEWMKVRGVRDQIAVICKGAHTPHCRPEVIGQELDKQLDWLQTTHCEFYFMHRDDPSVPVGEFVDAMNEEADAGRIRGMFGGSNWTLERVKEANAYAEANGKRGFGAISQNLSLAELVSPVWDGCVCAHTQEWLDFLAQTNTANFAWSSQARGFFVPDRDLGEEELQRCWVSDDNLKRRERAVELAEKKGVEPVAIAAAWVLKQAFPSFALIGPRSMSELRTSLAGLGVELTDEEHAWLDLK